MRVLILLGLAAALLVSVGVTTAAASHKFPASKQLCEGDGGTFSTKPNSSFFTPFYKSQGVVWTCNGYSGGSNASQALAQSCYSDGGQAASTLDAGYATCWKHPPL